MLLIIVILLLILTLPSIANIFLGTAVVTSIIKYFPVIVSFLLILITVYIYKNFNQLKWKYFSTKSEKIVINTIKTEFHKDPSLNPRDIFDLIVKKWVPISKKIYPDVKPKDLGVKLKITPDGIAERMIHMGLVYDFETGL